MLDAVPEVPDHSLHDAAVVEMTRAGKMCPAIADALGITVRRVQNIRQRLRAAGVDLPYVRGHSGGRPAKSARNSSIERAYLRGDPLRKISEAHGISLGATAKIVKRGIDAGRLRQRVVHTDHTARRLEAAIDLQDPAFRVWVEAQLGGGIEVLDVLMACAVDAWQEERG